MDKNMPKNEGIYITGGAINADQIAVGRNARAMKIVSSANEALERKGLQEIRDRLDELVNALTTHADALENPDELLDSAEVVAEELSKEKPNKFTLTSILSGIASSVQSVATIAAAAEALKHAITIFM
ncbi:MAG TPA: hypothetical protein VKR83_18945 [Ktedonobacteraceae bacterium]|nr:hypothetical protein [Ktedonobacteraceae bacterium]